MESSFSPARYSSQGSLHCVESEGTMKTRRLPSLCCGCIAAAPSSYRSVVASAAAATCKAQSASYSFHLCPQNSMQLRAAALRTVTPAGGQEKGGTPQKGCRLVSIRVLTSG